jgi:hypothetical protein
LFDIGFRQGLSVCHSVLKGLVQVDDHDDTGLNRNYEERP